MLKVFLVEDEFAVRESMKKNIDWQVHGFQLIGEAGDGELAYPMIQELQPDILITDIRMPFMDGLQLIELVKASMPKIKILILSGYDEFDYAKEAIRLGVTDYLLKPITSKKLLESLSRVANLIEEEREQEAYFTQWQRDNQEKLQLTKKKFFYDLVAGRQSVQVLIERAKTLKIDLTAMTYSIVLFKISFIGKLSVDDEETLRQTLKNSLGMHKHLLVFERDVDGYVILLKGSDDHIEDLEENLVTQLIELLKPYPDMHYTIAIGERINRISEIPYAYDTAGKALAYRYLLSDVQVLRYATLKDYNTFSSKVGIKSQEVIVSKIDKKKLENFLHDGTIEEVSTFINTYFNQLKEGLESYLFRQYLVMDIYFSITAFCEQLGVEQSRLEALYGNLNNVNSFVQDIDTLKQIAEQWLIQSIQLREKISHKRYDVFINQVKRYLQENYNKENLSLNQVADYVNISPSHLSTLFSQETGQTFVSYLTEIRMEKAKELLRCTNMKTLEIGYEVGYKDPHYFSYIFKKTQNCTPTEYRRG
nr:response regulator [uncultured Niameybacter sp.]